jgi:hypothetical protein
VISEEGSLTSAGRPPLTERACVILGLRVISAYYLVSRVLYLMFIPVFFLPREYLGSPETTLSALYARLVVLAVSLSHFFCPRQIARLLRAEDEAVFTGPAREVERAFFTTLLRLLCLAVVPDLVFILVLWGNTAFLDPAIFSPYIADPLAEAGFALFFALLALFTASYLVKIVLLPGRARTPGKEESPQ